MFPTILDTINANKVQKFFFFFQNSAKDRMTDCHISVAVKRRKGVISGKSALAHFQAFRLPNKT